MLNIPHMHNIQESENQKILHSPSSGESPRKRNCYCALDVSGKFVFMMETANIPIFSGL
jgi:hypothetical protein